MFGLLCFLVKKNPTAQSLTSRLRPLTRRASHPARMAAAAVVCGAAIVGTSSIARVSNRSIVATNDANDKVNQTL